MQGRLQHVGATGRQFEDIFPEDNFSGQHGVVRMACKDEFVFCQSVWNPTAPIIRCNWLRQDPPGRCILGSPSGPQICVKSGLPNLGGRFSAFTLGVVGFQAQKGFRSHNLGCQTWAPNILVFPFFCCYLFFFFHQVPHHIS